MGFFKLNAEFFCRSGFPCGLLGMTDLEKEIELVNDYSSEPTELFVFAGTYEPDLVPSGLLWRLSPMDQHAQVD